MLSIIIKALSAFIIPNNLTPIVLMTGKGGPPPQHAPGNISFFFSLSKPWNPLHHVINNGDACVAKFFFIKKELKEEEKSRTWSCQTEEETAWSIP